MFVYLVAFCITNKLNVVYPLQSPTLNPTSNPTGSPTEFVPISPDPTLNPTLSPTMNPTLSPTLNVSVPIDAYYSLHEKLTKYLLNFTIFFPLNCGSPQLHLPCLLCGRVSHCLTFRDKHLNITIHDSPAAVYNR